MVLQPELTQSPILLAGGRSCQSCSCSLSWMGPLRPGSPFLGALVCEN
jgi:hypothetical protein